MATHTATPHGNAAQPQDDIGAVLERFEQWSGKQRRPVAAAQAENHSAGSQRTAHLAYSSTHQMTRELSYEEALSRSRGRSRQYRGDESEMEGDTTKQPAPAAAAKAKQPTQPTEAPLAATKDGARTGVKTKAAARKTAQAGARSRKSVPAVSGPADHGKTRTAATSAKANGAKAKARQSGSKTKPGKAKSDTRKVGAPTNKVGASTNNTNTVTYEPTLQPASFRQVLSAQVNQALVPEMLLDPAPVHAEEISGTAVSLTVNLSVAERNALRMRAQQLGLAPDAYLRQCALEVESLRSELQEMLVKRMQFHSPGAPRQLPAQPRRDWLGRLKQYFFSRRTDCQAQIFRA